VGTASGEEGGLDEKILYWKTVRENTDDALLTIQDFPMAQTEETRATGKLV
jgi:hypothetical protein